MNGPSYFEIQADNAERVVKFYGTLFGWNFSKEPALPIEYWRRNRRAARRFAQASGEGVASGAVALSKFAVAGGRQEYFIDTEGNTFGLFQVDPNAK